MASYLKMVNIKIILENKNNIFEQRFRTNFNKSKSWLNNIFKNFNKVTLIHTIDGYGEEIGVYTAYAKNKIEQGYINLKDKTVFGKKMAKLGYTPIIKVN